jgi:hypothetical protein
MVFFVIPKHQKSVKKASANMSLTSSDRETRAKTSTRVPFSEDIAPKELYDEVARGIASNVKMGPFTATSGVVLPCMIYYYD